VQGPGGAAAGPSSLRTTSSLGVDWLVHHRRSTTTALVSLARIFERVDEALLPSVYLYVGCAFGATPTQLGAITLARALAQVRRVLSRGCRCSSSGDAGWQGAWPAAPGLCGPSSGGAGSMLGLTLLVGAACGRRLQALSSPLGGLAGHYLNRVHVIALAAYVWAACTAAFAFVNSVQAGVVLW